MHLIHRGALIVAALTTTAVVLTGCAGTDDSSTGTDASTSAEAGTWPRTVETDNGPVEIPAQPERIVSTATTLTGTLLAIDAPVVASSATSPNTDVADDQGFFTQWSSVAKERGVVPLRSADLGAEIVLNQNPDLIVVAATGGDSAIELYDQFSAIAPTIVVDYGDKTWQDIATVLGEATGHEDDAAAARDTFSGTVADAKAAIALPEQPTTAMVYNGSEGANIWTAESAQGRLLTDLGFTLADIPATVLGNESMGKRNDIVQVAPENYSTAFAGNTVILVNADQTDVDEFRADPLLVQHPAVVADHVYAVGLDTFRLDFYSATNMIESLKTQLT